MPPSQGSTLGNVQYNIILLGKTGAGKSATGNTFLGRKGFISKKSLKTVTQEVKVETVRFDGVTLDVYDTPGLFDPERNCKDIVEKYQLLLQLNPSVPTVFLLVMKADRFTPEEKETVELIEQFLGDQVQNTWILFTRGDELEREELTIEEFIEETEELDKVVKRLKKRYHVFNNITHNPDQVRDLIEKIRKTPLSSAQQCRFPQKTPLHPEKDPMERRIVLLGKTGVGKSAAGNTILREKDRFRSQFSLKSVTALSKVEEAVVAGRRVRVVDTPGLFDTRISSEDLAVEIGRSVYLSSPGAHAFLYVQPIDNRFTEQEEEVVDKLEQMFGEEMRKYTIILFTHGDQLEGESVEDLIRENKSLSRLVDQCGGHHVFNNKNLRNRQQVTDLLEKIDRMVEKNGGSCYSTEMFEDAAKCRLEEEERVMREEEERKQREKAQRQKEIEEVKKETEERIRKETEEEKAAFLQEQERKKQIEEEQRQEEKGFLHFLKKHWDTLLIIGIIGGGVVAVAGAGMFAAGSCVCIGKILMAGGGITCLSAAGAKLYQKYQEGASKHYTPKDSDESSDTLPLMENEDDD